jgi:hypothetical protein
MGWLNCSLSNGMRNQEEIERSIDNFRLLNKAVINIGSLWRIGNGGLTLLEESLSNTLVDNDQGMFWKGWIICLEAILLLDNLGQLLQLMADNLSSH